MVIYQIHVLLRFHATEFWKFYLNVYISLPAIRKTNTLICTSAQMSLFVISLHCTSNLFPKVIFTTDLSVWSNMREGADKFLADQEGKNLQPPTFGFVQHTPHEAQYTS